MPFPCPQIDVIGKEEPLSEEKLSPLLAMYRASTFESAVAKADRLVRMLLLLRPPGAQPRGRRCMVHWPRLPGAQPPPSQGPRLLRPG